MVAVPPATPHTCPDVEPVVLAVATVTSLLLHAPPGVASDKVVQDPWQTTTGVPEIALIGLTVSTLVAMHPVGKV
jgi:hypothetical protein